MKKTFRLALTVKNTKHKFGKGFAPGVLMIQDFVFDLPEERYESSMFAVSLMRQCDDFIEENIEVITTEIPNEDSND